VADDPNGQAALDKWLAQKDDLLAGRTPRPASDGLTVRDLANRFLTTKRLQANAGGAGTDFGGLEAVGELGWRI